MDDFFSDFRSPMRSNLFSDLRSPRRTNLRSRMPDMPNMSNMPNMPNMPNIRAPPTASEVYTEIRTTGGKLLPVRLEALCCFVAMENQGENIDYKLYFKISREE